MNNFIKGSFILTCGIGIGYLVTKNIYVKYYEKIIEDEVANVKLTYETFVIKDISVNKVEKNLKTEDVPEIETSNQYEKTKMLYKVNTYDVHIVGDEEIDDEYLEKTAFGKPDMTTNTIPYIITQIEYVQDCEDYDKICMDFYTHDNVLVDEDESAIDKKTAINMLGVVAYKKLCDSVSDIRIFVRNEQLHTDYEIGTVNDSYEETCEEEDVIRRELIAQKKNLTPREEFLNRQNKGGKE